MQILDNLFVLVMDRHNCFRSGNICKDGMWLHHRFDSVMISMKFHWHKKRICFGGNIL